LSAIQVALLALTVVGLPLAIIVARSLGTYLNPVNKKCVSLAVANEIEQRKAKEKIEKMQLK
jgi:uncharacterized membrane protein YccF (DUF307 family)